MVFEDGTKMRNCKKSPLGPNGLGVAFLLVVFLAGCGLQHAGIPFPVLSVISPSSGAQGATVAVTLTGTDFAPGCSVGVTGTGITISNTMVVSSTQITATFTIGATATPAQSVTVTCAGGTTGALPFTVLGPTLTAVSPNSGTQGQTVAVTLTGTNFAAGCTIGLSGTGITVTNTMVVSSTQITATFAIGAATAAGAQNVTAICPGGTTNTVPFTVTSLLPTVTSTSPANGATAVPINMVITATFSKAMNPATITTATFMVTGVTPVTGVVTYNAASNTAIFTPAAPLPVNTLFTATITAGAQDTAGNALVSGGSAPNPWTFTTGSSTDTTAPTVILTNPANLATGVPTNSAITATFSEAMNAATITTTTFTVTGPGVTPVVGTVSYAAVSNTAIFTPSAPLAANTLFTATVTAGATDLAGNALAGGAAPNPWTFTTGATLDSTPPTITLTNPANAAVGVAINASVNATFSEAMDPSTISTGTFTLAGPGVTPVTGSVTYDPISRVATFTPASPLAINSTFTATVTTGARDLAGNALVGGAVPNPWTFTTGSTSAGQPVVNLLSAANFAILAGSTVSNVGPTIINGDLGVSPGTAVVGFPPGIVNGTQYIDPDPIVQQAKLDLTTAFIDAAGRSLNVITVASGELGGLTLAPGLYMSGIGSFAITSVNLTLDAQGDANAVWIFQMPSSTLTVGNGRQVILSGGAQAKNIFWSVGSSATLGTTVIFKGNILADQSITLQTGAVLDGRALTRIAAVTLDSNVVTKPAP